MASAVTHCQLALPRRSASPRVSSSSPVCAALRAGTRGELAGQQLRLRARVGQLAGLRSRQLPGASRHLVVRMSFFGVGAPEALVIGVVALLVFGPKGLAEAARSLGKTLRAFQPAIRELQEVSRDFRGTIEREIGMDEYRQPPTYSTPPRPREDWEANVADEARAASERAAWGGNPPPKNTTTSSTVASELTQPSSEHKSAAAERPTTQSEQQGSSSAAQPKAEKSKADGVAEAPSKPQAQQAPLSDRSA
eukprot:jgi/Chlat1/8223/Chrsp76S07639